MPVLMSETRNQMLLHRAVELAGRGHGCVEPNPMVGCIVLSKDGEIAGEGFHEQCGDSHAEINALNQAGARARGGTAYVTLEPCNHDGRTGPCTQALLEAGIEKVVIGCRDPHPDAAGGATFLSQNGVDVVIEENVVCKDLIAPFVHRLRHGIPWVTCKWAQTSDGYIETPTGEPPWISCDESLQLVHQKRGCIDAIIVGVGTVVADNPSLTVRDAVAHRTPLRIVVDPTLRTPLKAQVLDGAVPTLIAYGKNANPIRLARTRVALLELPWLDGSLDLRPLFTHLVQEYNATNVIVEGGKTLFGHIFDQNLANELWVFTSPRALGEVPLQNMDALFDALPCHRVDQYTCGDDSVCRYRVNMEN